MTSSPLLKRQAFRLSLRHQASNSVLKHQAWLTTHVRNTEDLAGLICPSDRSNRLGLSISSGIVSPPKRSASLVCPFYLALWNNENFSLMVPDGVYLGPDEWSQMGYMFVLVGQKVLSMGMTRGGPPQCPIIHMPLSDKVAVGLRYDGLFVFKFLGAYGCVKLQHNFSTILWILLLPAFSICRTTQLLRQ